MSCSSSRIAVLKLTPWDVIKGSVSKSKMLLSLSDGEYTYLTVYKRQNPVLAQSNEGANAACQKGPNYEVSARKRHDKVIITTQGLKFSNEPWLFRALTFTSSQDFQENLDDATSCWTHGSGYTKYFIFVQVMVSRVCLRAIIRKTCHPERLIKHANYRITWRSLTWRII